MDTTKKLGALGGKSQKTKSDLANHQNAQASTSFVAPEQQTRQTSEDRASGVTDRHDHSRNPKGSQRTGKSATKLGAIGGKKKQQSVPRSPSPQENIPNKSATPTPTTTKTKLGAIGGHKSKLPERMTVSPVSQTPPKRKAAETSSQSNAKHLKEADSKDAKDIGASEVKAPMETEEEKADRKRNELKSKLERGPIQKKKRKF